MSDSIQPARRTQLLGFSDIVKIRNRVIAMLQGGAQVFRLEGGEPFAPTPAFIKDALKNALDANHTRYAPSSGIPELLEAIVKKLADRNSLPIDATNAIVTSGGAHGLFCAFQACVNPGEEVLLFSPYWTPIRDHITYAGGVPVRVPWERVRGVAGAGAVLEQFSGSRTRILYLNSPANPTGDVLDRSQLESIAEFARSRNLVVISDEAYEDLHYDTQHVSIASFPGMFERTISVYTLSKSFAMTGLRTGYVVAAEVWMDVLRKLVLNSINGVSTPTQYAAVAAIREGRSFVESQLPQYRERRDRLVEALNEAGLPCVNPAGAFYVFPDVSGRLGTDSWKAMEALLEQTSIASVPGVVFGAEGEGHLRLSCSVAMPVLEQAIGSLKQL